MKSPLAETLGGLRVSGLGRQMREAVMNSAAVMAA
jgi:hypothetical protein